MANRKPDRGSGDVVRRGNNQWPRRLENKLLVLQGSTYAQLLYMYMFANNPHQLSSFYINFHFRHRLVQFTHYICKYILHSLNIHASAERSRFEIPLISWLLDTSTCKSLHLFPLKHIHSVHRTDVNFTSDNHPVPQSHATNSASASMALASINFKTSGFLGTSRILNGCGRLTRPPTNALSSGGAGRPSLLSAGSMSKAHNILGGF